MKQTCTFTLAALLTAAAAGAQQSPGVPGAVRQAHGVLSSPEHAPGTPPGIPSAVAALGTPSIAPAVALKVDEAVARAIERNLDIAVERLNPQTFDLSLAALRAAYKPTFTSALGQRSQVLRPTSQLVGGERVNNDTLTYNTGVTQMLPWGGGSVAASFNNSRLDSSNIFATRNPQYQSAFNVTFTQPLLRGFATDLTRTEVAVARINQGVAETGVRAATTATIASARNAYWDLVYAIQAAEVATQSLDLADAQNVELRARLDHRKALVDFERVQQTS